MAIFHKYFTPHFWIEHYFYETLFVITCIIFTLNYLYGSKTNNLIASKHFNMMKQYVEQQFKNVGKFKGSKDYQLYHQDNPHIFKLYASDHTYINFCLISLYVLFVFYYKLSSRENLFIQYGYDFLFPHKERVLIELGVQMIYRGSICFGITRQSQIKKIQKEGYEDLKNLCHQLKVPNLNSEFQVLTEFDEIAHQICTEEIIQTLNELEKSIHIIYVSDVDKDPSGKVQLRIMTNLQQSPDYQTLFKLVALLARQINMLKLDQKVYQFLRYLETIQSLIKQKKVQFKVQLIIDYQKQLCNKTVVLFLSINFMYCRNLSRIQCKTLNSNNEEMAQHIDNISYICLKEKCRYRFQGYCVKCVQQRHHNHEQILISDVIINFKQSDKAIKDPLEEVIESIKGIQNKFIKIFGTIIQTFEDQLKEKYHQLNSFQNMYFHRSQKELQIGLDCGQVYLVLSELDSLFTSENREMFISNSNLISGTVGKTQYNLQQKQIIQLLNSTTKELQKISKSLQQFDLGNEINKKALFRFKDLDEPMAKSIELQNTVSSCFKFKLHPDKQLKSIFVLGLYLPLLKRFDNKLKIQIQIRKNILKSYPLLQKDIELIHNELLKNCPAFQDRYFIDFKDFKVIELKDNDLIIISIKPSQIIEFRKFRSSQGMDYLESYEEFLRDQNEFVNDQIIGGFFVQENYD